MCPTQGAVQRLIWYCRQGRVRLANSLSVQLRSGKARDRAFSVTWTAPVEAKGPKYSPGMSRAPRCLVMRGKGLRSEEHTSELQSLMRISYAVFSLKKQKQHTTINE